MLWNFTTLSPFPYFLKKDVTQFKEMRKREGTVLKKKKKEQEKKGNDFDLQGIEFMAIRPETCARIRRSWIVLHILNSISSCILNHCITTLAYVGNQIIGTLFQPYCGPFPESPSVKLFFFTCKIDGNFHSFASNMVKLSVNETK